MNIVIDSNVLFSALIRGGITRKIILDSNSSFLFPQYIFLELERNKEELLIKSNMGKEDFDNLFKIILERITVVPTRTTFKKGLGSN